jgi:ribosome-associated protein
VTSRDLARQIAVAALEKKAGDLLILDLRKLETITDFFVICTGDVDQHVRAIAIHVEDAVRRTLGQRVFHREGMDGLNWVLLDYVDVVVHIFKPSFRAFYRLDELWSDAEIIPVGEEAAVPKAKPPRRKRTAEVQPVEAKKPTRRAAVKAKTSGTARAKKTSVVKKPTSKPATKLRKPKA